MDNYRRLRSGMTEAQVEQILGRPGDPGDEHPNYLVRQWGGDKDEVGIVLFFEQKDGLLAEGVVWPSGAASSGIKYSEYLPEPEGPLDRLRRWLGW
jgi:hypothetical protein